MAIDDAFFGTWSPRALAVLRIVTAYLFIVHGTAKVFGAPHVAMFDGLQLISLIGVAGLLELVGGALLMGAGAWSVDAVRRRAWGPKPRSLSLSRL